MKNAEIYGINDGYGLVGFGFHCEKCSTNNEFIDEDATEVVCEECGEHYSVDEKEWIPFK